MDDFMDGFMGLEAFPGDCLVALLDMMFWQFAMRRC